VHPSFYVDEPVVSSDPEVAIGSEFLDHGVDLTVICHVHVEKILPGVELSGLLLKRE
jgi:hypothetical protein